MLIRADIRGFSELVGHGRRNNYADAWLMPHSSGGVSPVAGPVGFPKLQPQRRSQYRNLTHLIRFEQRGSRHDACTFFILAKRLAVAKGRPQSHKSFRTKKKLAKAQKQNRPIPQWIRLRTGNTIRFAIPLDRTKNWMMGGLRSRGS